MKPGKLTKREFATLSELEAENYKLARIQEWAGLTFQRKLTRVLDRAAAHIQLKLKDAKRDRAGNLKIDALNQAMVLNIAGDLQRILVDAGYSDIVEEHLGRYSALFDQARKLWGETGIPFSFDQADIDALQAIADQDATYFGRLPQLAVASVEKALTESVLVGANFQVAASAIAAALSAESSPFARYAFTYANDSILNFTAAMAAVRDRKFKPQLYYYAGNIIKTSRDFCRARAGRVWPAEEVRKWEKYDWRGKKPGPILVVRGGWNCKHTLIAVSRAWAMANALTPEAKPAPVPVPPKRRKPPGLEGASYLPGAPKGAKLLTRGGAIVLPAAARTPPEKPPRPERPKAKEVAYSWGKLKDDRLPRFDGKSRTKGGHNWVRSPRGFKVAWCDDDRIPIAGSPRSGYLKLGKKRGLHQVWAVKEAVRRMEELFAGIEGPKKFKEFLDEVEIVFLSHEPTDGAAGFMWAKHPRRIYVSGNNRGASLAGSLSDERRREVVRIAKKLAAAGKISRDRLEEIREGVESLDGVETMAGTMAHELGHCWHRLRLGDWRRQDPASYATLDGKAWQKYWELAKKRLDAHLDTLASRWLEIVADDMRLILFGEEYARKVRPNYQCMEHDIENPERAAEARRHLMKALGLKRVEPKPEPEPEIPEPELDTYQKATLNYARENGALTKARIKELSDKYGLTEREIVTLSERLAKETPLVINRRLANKDDGTPGRSYMDLLENGKMKNQFQLGAEFGVWGVTSGGAYDPYKSGCRDSWERTLSNGNLHKDPEYGKIGHRALFSVAAAAKRPIYGYLQDTDRPFTGGAYGHISFVLKDSVKQRASLTLGNSSGLSPRKIKERGALLTPYENYGAVRSLLESMGGAAARKMLAGKAPLEGHSRPHVYIESQIYGGIDLRRDVKEIVIQHPAIDAPDFKHILDLAKKWGLPVRFWNRAKGEYERPT